MHCTTLGLSLTVLFLAIASVNAEDPKFAQLKTADLATGSAPDLKGGILFKGGALDLSANPSAMILAEFRNPDRVEFVHVKMIYKGDYTDPNTKVAGYLYHLKEGSYDRYFFVSKTGISTPTNPERWVIDYSDQGVPLAYFQGRFAPKP